MRTSRKIETIARSALKRAYRDILVGERCDVRIVHLKGERDLIARRLAARDGHFMPPSLLDDRFHETGRHGTGDLFVDSPFGFD